MMFHLVERIGTTRQGLFELEEIAIGLLIRFSMREFQSACFQMPLETPLILRIMFHLACHHKQQLAHQLALQIFPKEIRQHQGLQLQTLQSAFSMRS